jgi:tetratricopeptide (TPR) repeat protein
MRLLIIAAMLTCATCAFGQDQMDASAYNDRGNARRGILDVDGAIADFSEAIRLNPRFAAAYTNRAFAWLNKREYVKAIADLDQAIRLNPKNPAAYTNRALAWNVKGEYVKAIADYEEAIRLDPQCVLAYCNLAWLLATCPLKAIRDGKKALEYATKACELAEQKEAHHFGALAAAYAESCDFEKAIKWQEKALSISPEMVKDHFQSTLELYKSGKPYHEPSKEN